MPIVRNLITKEQVARITKQSESHFLDFKARAVSPAKLSQSISAFANSDGGEIYIGIEDTSHKWYGFKDEEDANGHLQIFEELFPLGQDFSYNFLESTSEYGLVLQVTIQKTRDVKYASNGKPYVRRGAQNLPCDAPEALKRLEYNKGVSSFESATVPVELKTVTNSIPTLEFILDVIPTVEPEDWFRKQQLIQTDKPTVAAILLFAEEPQAILPKKCGIKIYRYKTKNSVGSRDTLASEPVTIEGCLYDQIKRAVSETINIIETIQILGNSGFESIKYPVEALHEIITNAALHRDYSIPDDIHVRIFDNRIEVQSPGSLPGHVTVKNILKERYARNPTIVRLINKFPDPPNKDVGEGLNTAFEAMRKLRLKPPVIQELDSSVLVTINHESLASAEEQIMEYLNDHDEIRNSTAREVCNIGSENTMKNILLRLVSRGLIERVPNKSGNRTAYRKKTTS